MDLASSVSDEDYTYGGLLRELEINLALGLGMTEEKPIHDRDTVRELTAKYLADYFKDVTDTPKKSLKLNPFVDILMSGIPAKLKTFHVRFYNALTTKS